jgi:hypothetical protein
MAYAASARTVARFVILAAIAYLAAVGLFRTAHSASAPCSPPSTPSCPGEWWAGVQGTYSVQGIQGRIGVPATTLQYPTREGFAHWAGLHQSNSWGLEWGQAGVANGAVNGGGNVSTYKRYLEWKSWCDGYSWNEAGARSASITDHYSVEYTGVVYDCGSGGATYVQQMRIRVGVTSILRYTRLYLGTPKASTEFSVLVDNGSFDPVGASGQKPCFGGSLIGTLCDPVAAYRFQRRESGAWLDWSLALGGTVVQSGGGYSPAFIDFYYRFRVQSTY